MNTERQTLTARRDELLSKMNAAGRWTQAEYDEVQGIEKRISGLPEDQPELELKPPKKPR
ncbi:hypothetical protein IB276_33325 [Ensifer sp. ENS04]|uniref:hypothetical protein n=1 Tax=Ensifer sp. ENS04 TaxID=2769281 RepID=UPI00178458A5|nr:hypothetical protein [Ensifer sp. ENS04]MBD9544330.1 hypothetical protein [Ensifer sp. ENS04]